MKTENKTIKVSSIHADLDTPLNFIGVDIEEFVKNDEFSPIERALEVEMPHLSLMLAFDECFRAGENCHKDSLPSAMLFLSLKGEICTATTRACQLMGRPLSQLKGKSLIQFWRDRDRQRFGLNYLKYLKQARIPGRVHYLNLETFDGGFIPIKMKTERFENQIAVTIDSISAKEIINRAIDRDYASLKEFADSFPFPVFRKDVEHRFTLANAEFCWDLSCSRVEDVVNHLDSDFFPADQAKKYIADDDYVLRCGQILETTELHTPPHGSPIQVHVFKLPAFRDGRVDGVICMYWPVEMRGKALGLLNFKG